jgi:ferritin-like metal-binding protein YciE
MVMQIAERAGAQETISVLDRNMKEEQSMADWIMANTPVMLDQLWPKIQAAAMSSGR